jgi:hypothetical protein
MSDELRAAAERLKSAVDLSDHADIGDILFTYREPTRPRAKDVFLLAEAYLSSHPADSETPIDEEWLRSVGGKGDPWHDDSMSLATFRVPTIGMNVATLDFRRRNREVHIGGTVMAKTPKTRSDVRRLCAALGIELKEPASA